MLLAKQITGFLNQLYLENKMMKISEFLHLNAKSLKLKVDLKILRWAGSKMSVPTLVAEIKSKIVCIAQRN